MKQLDELNEWKDTSRGKTHCCLQRTETHFPTTLSAQRHVNEPLLSPVHHFKIRKTSNCASTEKKRLNVFLGPSETCRVIVATMPKSSPLVAQLLSPRLWQISSSYTVIIFWLLQTENYRDVQIVLSAGLRGNRHIYCLFLEDWAIISHHLTSLYITSLLQNCHQWLEDTISKNLFQQERWYTQEN